VPGPTFLVAGAARSATTAVVEVLRAQANVFITQPKEPHYFAFAGHKVDFRGPGDNETMNRVSVTDTRRYLSLYDNSTNQHVARGEGSVSTLYYYSHSIGEIRKMNPQMKIVLLLREPIARAYSSFQYLRARGYEPIVDFAEALRQEPQRKAANWHHLWHYTSMSHYGPQVSALMAAFGHEQVRVWLYEDLVADPSIVLSSIVEFVGGSGGASLSRIQKVNVSGEVRLPRLHAMQLWLARQPTLRALVKRVVPFGTRERIRTAGLRATSIPEVCRAELSAAFKDDVMELRSLLGRSLAEWAD
jgi:hypothetical protein